MIRNYFNMKNVYIIFLFSSLAIMSNAQVLGPSIKISGACTGYTLELNGVEYQDNGVGTTCWDTNANGINDPDEDVNGDGIFNIHDCLDCWDTNNNGVQDANEDTNGDGVWDTWDCDTNGTIAFRCERWGSSDVMLGSTNLLEITDQEAGYNGISTLDIVNILRWLLFEFPGSLEAITSDFDGDGTVSTSDLRDLRRYILGIDLFPQYNKYLVVEDGFVFPDVDPFNLNVDYTSLTFSDSDVVNEVLSVFVFRQGDVDQSALFRDDELEDRSRASLSFEDIELKAGETYAIPFSISDDSGLLGSTFRLSSKNLEIQKLDSKEYASSILFHNEGHQIGISYAASESKDEVSFELTLIATEDNYLSELISLDETFLKETVDAEYNTRTLSLNPVVSNTNIVTEDKVRIYPNPVQEVLTIEFPSSDNRVITLSSISGQQIVSYVSTQDRLEIPRDPSLGEGLYLLSIHSSDKSKTYKLFYK